MDTQRVWTAICAIALTTTTSLLAIASATTPASTRAAHPSVAAAAAATDGYGLRTPDAIDHWTASLKKKASTDGS